MIGVFVDEGPVLAPLLSRAAAHGIMTPFIDEILAGFGVQPVLEDLPLGPVGQAMDALPEALTARELEVLRMIADGLSNDQICVRLHRALSTVKGYNQSIFAKLQVGRRTEAVARARELNLL